MGTLTPDVAVIGAGIIGGSIAWRLAQRGLRVVLFDAGRMGGEASTAGAGMLAPGGEVLMRSRWAQRSLDSHRLWPHFAAELREETGLDAGLRMCGALELAADDGEWHELDARAAEQARIGIPSRPISRPEALGLAPGLNPDAFVAARNFPEDGLVDSPAVMRALRAANLKRGVEIREDTRITQVSAIAAGAIVIAAGAWSGQLAPNLPRSKPIKGHLIGWQLAPNSVPVILRHGHTYVLQRSSGFTLAGSTTEDVGFDRHIDLAVVENLHRNAARLLPGTLAQPPEIAWIGFRPAVEGPEPEVRRLPGTNLWLAYGHYRNGILLAPISAELVTAEITSSLGRASLGRD